MQFSSDLASRALIVFLGAFTSLFAVATDQYEPNDTKENATYLFPGDDLQTHTLDPAKDVDWFRANLRVERDEVGYPIPYPYTIVVRNVSENIDVDFNVWDSEGKLIGQAYEPEAGGEESFEFLPPKTGTYFIEVFDEPCINEGLGCADARGDEAQYEIHIYIPLGALGGTDLSIEHQYVGSPEVGAPFELTLYVKNNGGQEGDDTAKNVLVEVFSSPQVEAPSDLPSECVGETGRVTCKVDSLEAGDSLSYPFNFSFTEAGSVRFTSTVAGFEKADLKNIQRDDKTSNNYVDEVFTVVEGSGGGGTDQDSDGDGKPDASDNCPSDANPDQKDFDEDSKGDVCDDDDDNDGILDDDDRYPLVAIGDLTDTDKDGAPDACDSACEAKGMKADDDDDDDGILDDDDRYPLVAIGNLTDTDKDGAPDDCDEGCQADGMAADDDDDNDGVLDEDDYFSTISLGGRKDTDGDGLPNDCDETCVAAGLLEDLDDDNDTVPDVDDAFPEDPGESKDFDGDKIGDNTDDDDDDDGVLDNDDKFQNDPRGGLDADGDGMADEWEEKYGLDSSDATDADSDADNDGISALEEFKADTDPTASDLKVQQLRFDAPASLVSGVAAEISVVYSTSDNNAASEGIGFNLHYNSEAIEGSIIEGLTYFATGAESTGDAEIADSDDLDGNEKTDVYRTFEWADESGEWPGEEQLPLTLLTLLVKASDETDQLVLGISVSTAAEGYSAQGDDLVVPIQAPAKDTDGDGVDDAVDLFPNDARGGLDADNDGMADEWESLVGLDPSDASDANSDTDNDGATALEEFKRDTNPAKPDLEQQRLTWNAPSFLVTDQPAMIELVYTTSNNDASTTGLAFKVFYNKAVLEGLFLQEDVAYSEGRVESTGVVDDLDNEDNDVKTDVYQIFEWSDANGNWPGEGKLPLTLLSGTVTPDSSVTQLIVNILSVATAKGYELSADNLRLSIGAASLDIDGDGKATALKDGLLVIRYLFGFRGPSLVEGAVGAKATRTTPEEIEAVIEALIP